jgi:uncharacterized protein YggE
MLRPNSWFHWRTGFLIVACFVSLTASAAAQHGGLRAGLDPLRADSLELPSLDPRVAQSHIAIAGRAELRVPPTEVRITLAVTAEGENAQDCRKQVAATIDALSAAWQKLGIGKDEIVVDFIAILPRYEWVMEKRGDVAVGVEKKAGYRMQTNVHVAVKNGKQVDAALDSAFEQGVTDIIAFDYWSEDLDAVKVQAREQAMEAAINISNTLLAVFLKDRPPVINIQEETHVIFPESLYHSFGNAAQEDIAVPARRDISFIRAHRPQNTYYRGLQSRSDTQPKELVMRPEISVISSVRIYYESPGVKNLNKSDD